MVAMNPGAIRIGSAGWTIPRGVSDQVAGNGTHLERYSRSFACAEINSTFYRSHRQTTWSRWADSVPDDFRFSVKAPRAITHEAKLDCSEEQLNAFLMEVRTLGHKLGPVLFQLPPRLQFDETRVRLFLAMLRDLHHRSAISDTIAPDSIAPDCIAPESGLPASVVFEPRHESWFTNAADQILREFDVARASADPAITAQASLPGGSTSLIYYRLHGSPRRYYSSYETAVLRSLASEMCAQSLHSNVWCIFDNTASGAALGNALTLTHLLAAKQDHK